MKSNLEYPFDVIESVLATLFGHGILFAAVVVVGLSFGSIVRQGRLIEPGGIVLAIAITSVGWMDSLHLLAVCLISLATTTVFVLSESRVDIAGWLIALCAAWCSVGLWLW